MFSSICCPWFQAPINAQMLAQRQREILNQHLRQRQMHQQQQVQQRTLMMRGQGLNMTPSMVAPSGMPATMSNPRIPQANAQQFPFPPNYGTGLTSPPPFTSPFSPVSPSPGSQLLSHSSLHGSQMNLANQGMIGNLGGQLGPVRSPQVQHSTFQALSSGTTFLWVQVLLKNDRSKCVCVERVYLIYRVCECVWVYLFLSVSMNTGVYVYIDIYVWIPLSLTQTNQ